MRRYEGPDWRPEQIFLNAAHDSRKERLEEFICCKVTDSPGPIRIVGQVSELDTGPAPTSPSVAPLAWREIRQMVAARPPRSFGGAVRSTLSNRVRDGDFTLVGLSRVFRLHPRTVQRRLAAEGPGFGQILEEVRRAYAEHLLAETQLTMRELAKRLGYTSRQHFIRAFQSWSGMNPGTFRQKVRSGDHLADP
jgi:AraC-like DNA-binding protein